jgi:hypothetical protein
MEFFGGNDTGCSDGCSGGGEIGGEIFLFILFIHIRIHLLLTPLSPSKGINFVGSAILYYSFTQTPLSFLQYRPLEDLKRRLYNRFCPCRNNGIILGTTRGQRRRRRCGDGGDGSLTGRRLCRFSLLYFLTPSRTEGFEFV